MYTIYIKVIIFGCLKKQLKMNKDTRIKTTIKVGLIYVLIASVAALIANCNEVLIYLKSLF